MWEGVVLSRKVAVTILSVIFQGMFITQAMFLLIIIYFSSFLVGKFQPFEDASERRERKAKAEIGVLGSKFLRRIGTRTRDHHEARTCSKKIERYLDSVDLNTLEGGSLSVSLLIFTFGVILSITNANARETDRAEEASKEGQVLTYLIVILNFGYLLYMTVCCTFCVYYLEKLICI